MVYSLNVAVFSIRMIYFIGHIISFRVQRFFRFFISLPLALSVFIFLDYIYNEKFWSLDIFCFPSRRFSIRRWCVSASFLFLFIYSCFSHEIFALSRSMGVLVSECALFYCCFCCAVACGFYNSVSVSSSFFLLSFKYLSLQFFMCESGQWFRKCIWKKNKTKWFSL